MFWKQPVIKALILAIKNRQKKQLAQYSIKNFPFLSLARQPQKQFHPQYLSTIDLADKLRVRCVD
jgi:hypothetical protein